METNNRIKKLSDRLVAVMREMDTLRGELLEINKDLEALSGQVEVSGVDASSVDDVFVGVGAMPTFTPLHSESIVAETTPVVDRPDYGKKKLSDFVSVIDMFRFQRELFGDDAHEMARVFEELEQMNTQSEALTYISDILNLDHSHETVSDLLKLTASYYSDDH
ncbi:hypothetical protein [Porphyromonas cangingivalis]|uniref:hypothetical protein n=1 Tax=Porphyromonas cangingivalis TaxID=36874 RepID=UPI00068CBD3A|nr:hypothetical protein [Porphyromonas cangingivalis]